VVKAKAKDNTKKNEQGKSKMKLKGKTVTKELMSRGEGLSRSVGERRQGKPLFSGTIVPEEKKKKRKKESSATVLKGVS
jgi:hypothetical protein